MIMKKSVKLRELFTQSRIIRTIGVYDGLTAILGKKNGFDALWASGYEISAANGVPDASILTMTEFLQAANTINKVTDLPVIADCDTGFGGINNVIRMVQDYEAAGIAAVCIEDKEFPKKNSFLEGHKLADMYEFSTKIIAAKNAQSDPDFIVIARVEALIANAGMDDALQRARIYCNAGADAILIHSKSKNPFEVFEFASRWQSIGCENPLIVVPTTYYTVTEKELSANGIKMVIYANQSIRASVAAINHVMTNIIASATSVPVENTIASLNDLFILTGTDKLMATEDWFNQAVSQAKKRT